MPNQNRTIVDDLRKPGGAEVRPAARQVDNFFISGSSRPLDFNDINFHRVGQDLAQGVGGVLLAHEGEQIDLGSQEFADRFAKAQSENVSAEKAFAKAVSQGEIEEERSPYFLIGYRKAAARAFAAQWFAQAKTMIEEGGAQAGTIDEATGIPRGSADPGQIMESTFTQASEAGKSVNPKLFADGYFTRELNRERAQMIPHLMALSVDQQAQARKVAHRETLHGELMQALRGVGDFSDTDPDAIRSRTQHIQDWVTENVYRKSVAKPHDLVWSTVEAAVSEAASGPSGPQGAQELLHRLRAIKIGNVRLDEGQHAGDVVSLDQHLWARAQQEDNLADAKLERESKRAMKAWMESPEGTYHKAIAAADERELDGVIVDFKRAAAAGTADIAQGQFQEALSKLMGLRAAAAATSEAQSKAQLQDAKRLLNEGRIDAAKAMIPALRGPESDNLEQDIERHRSGVVHWTFNNPQMRTVLDQLGKVAASSKFLSETARNGAVEAGEQRVEAFVNQMNEELLAVPEAQRRPVFLKKLGEANALLKEMRTDAVKADKEYAAVLNPLQADMEVGISVRPKIEALVAAETIDEETADKLRALDDKTVTGFFGQVDKGMAEVAEEVKANVTSAANFSYSNEGIPGGKWFDEGLMKSVAIPGNAPGAPTTYHTALTDKGRKFIRETTDSIRNDLIKLAQSDEGRAVRAGGEGVFSVWLDMQKGALLDKALGGLNDGVKEAEAEADAPDESEAEKAKPEPSDGTVDEAAKAAGEAVAREAKASQEIDESFGSPSIQESAVTGVDWKDLPVPWHIDAYGLDPSKPINGRNQRWHLDDIKQRVRDGLFGQTGIAFRTNVDRDVGEQLTQLRTNNARGAELFPHTRAVTAVASREWWTDKTVHPHVATAVALAKVANKAPDAASWIAFANWQHEKFIDAMWGKGDLFTAARTSLTHDERLRGEIAVRRYLGIDAQSVIDGYYEDQVGDIDWTVSPLYKSSGALLDAMAPGGNAKALFRALHIRFDDSKPLLDQDVGLQFIRVQQSAIKRITP